MIHRLLLPLFLLAGAAHADPVRVRTGEHAAFTRVVLTIPAGSDWRLGRNAQGYVLRLPVTQGYDLRSFFELIPRDRIAGVSQDVNAGELLLKVDCVCAAEAFLDQPNILVIDIRDGVPAADGLFEVALDDPLGVPSLSPVNQFEVARDQLIPLIVEAEQQPPAPVVEAEVGEVTVEASTDPIMPPGLRTTGADLADLEQSVVESLGRALSQGLLEPELQDPVLGANKGVVDVAAPGVQAQTGIDQATLPNNPEINVTQDGRSCQPDHIFEVANWGDDRPYAVQIAQTRANLTTETDRIDEVAVVTLARNFIYFGFGREAMQTLELDGVRSMERDYLIAMAKIIDGDPFDRALFAQQASCNTQVALWAFLASGPDAVDTEVNRASVIRAFMALPEALKYHLAPTLSQRFVAVGDSDAALQIMNVLDGKPDAPVAADIAQVELMRSLGEEGAAIAQLTEIVDTNTRVTPDVVVAYFNDAIENDLPLGPDDFLLADTLRFENAGLPAARDIAVAQIRAHIYLAEFESASEIMRRQRDKIAAETLMKLESEFWRRAVETMEASTFLSYAFEPLPNGLAAAVETAIARRLLALGFPDRAREIIQEGEPGDETADRVYLRAEAALALNETQAALAELARHTSERANEIRRTAIELEQSNGLTAQAYAEDDEQQILWRRGNWSALIGSDDELLSAVSKAVLDGEIGSLDADTPLKSGQVLLDKSAHSREIMNDLLMRFTVSGDT